MKKKLLSLVLAGAMVASTSVSAFATTADETYEVQPNSAANAEVEIRGDIESSKGDVLPGSVEVTVPTNASFTVKKDGTLEAGSMVIRNRGNSKVSVIASKFVDANGNKGIELVKEEANLEQNNRSKVYLKLTGGDKEVVLTSEENGSGEPAGKMYDVRDINTSIGENDDFVIKKVNAGGTATLTLKGKGTAYNEGTNSGDAVNDSFRLVFKIKQEI